MLFRSLWRRYQGYDHGPLPEAEAFRVGLTPMEAVLARKAVVEALTAGFAQEETEKPGTVDKGLLALQKNGGEIKRGAYLDAAAGFLGLGLREALLLPVGLVLDLVELKIRRLGGRKKE